MIDSLPFGSFYHCGNGFCRWQGATSSTSSKPTVSSEIRLKSHESSSVRDVNRISVALFCAGALSAAFQSRHHGRRRLITRRAQGAVEVSTRLSISDVQTSWESLESLGRTAEEIAELCALLCCVQRQLGYWAALHEGALGTGSLVSQAPALPLVISWEGTGTVDEVYGMSLAETKSSSLLYQLLNCMKRSKTDKRFSRPRGNDLKAKVSLLNEFVDISTNMKDWIPGKHGLWYSDGSQAQFVYLPEVAKKIADGASAETVVEQLLKKMRDSSADEDVDEDTTKGLPAGHLLFRFEARQGECPIANLPSLRTRMVSDEHMRSVLYAQARIRAGLDDGRKDGLAPRFAVLTSASETPRARAFIVPGAGTFSFAEIGFSQGLKSQQPVGLAEVRRIFVLAPVWDCYIDGCGIPEQRCAWYGKVPLDIPELEQLRRSKAFQELSVEQDERERSIEALLPLVKSCLAEDQDFTLVPVLVGGLMSQKAETYSKILAPYIADPANLFIVAGEVQDLVDGLNNNKRKPLEFDGPKRFMIEESKFVNRKDEVVPIFSALELFLAVLAQSPSTEQLSLNRYW